MKVLLETMNNAGTHTTPFLVPVTNEESAQRHVTAHPTPALYSALYPPLYKEPSTQPFLPSRLWREGCQRRRPQTTHMYKSSPVFKPGLYERWKILTELWRIP